MIIAGLVLIAISALAAVPLFEQGALEWLTENSTCNDRPCTEEESRTIATVISIGSGATGLSLLVVGLGRAVRGRSEAPDLAELMGRTGGDWDDRMEALAKLDEAYGRGDINEGTYLKRKRELTG